MLSLNIFEKSKKEDLNLNKSASTFADSPFSVESATEKKLLKIKSDIEENVKRILSGEFNKDNDDENEMHGRQGGPGGPGGPMGMNNMNANMRGFPQGSDVSPYRSKYELFKMVGFLLLNISGLLFFRQVSYRIVRK